MWGIEGVKQQGDTNLQKKVRQERVRRLLIRGLTSTEIAKQEGVGERTIQRDTQEIKFSLMQIIQTQRLRTYRLALAELDEIWRELWVLYHRVPRDVPTERDGQIVMTKEDDRPAKTTILTMLMRVSEAKNRLFLQLPAPSTPNADQTSFQQVPDRIVADFIDTLPDQLRKSVFDALKKRVDIPETDS